MEEFSAVLDRADQGAVLTVDDAEILLGASGDALEQLLAVAGKVRDAGAAQRGDATGKRITYSKKVFIPLTTLCRDRCHYCVFVDTPGGLREQNKPPFMPPEDILALAFEGAEMGCKEALFTLGDRPESRWSVAAEWLAEHGYESTLDYVREMGEMVLRETGLLPHFNPGVMSWLELQRLRPTSPSMGMMLETTSSKLWLEPGQPHFGSPDKDPQLRLQVLDDAGRSRIPFTTGILLGIGETLRDRAESIIAIRDSHRKWGHVQETIVQNFRAKPRTAMMGHRDLETEEYLAGVAVTRLMMGPGAHIQAPPNLTDPDELHSLIRAGIDDWGGVSPLTPDHVNPERPWPQIDKLAALTAEVGYELGERLTAHPRWTAEPEYWLDAQLHQPVALIEQTQTAVPVILVDSEHQVLRRARQHPESLTNRDFVAMLQFRGPALDQLSEVADAVRQETVGDELTYVINRNIDASQYDPKQTFGGVDQAAVRALATEAGDAGATEMCIQGMLPADLPGESYLELVDAARANPGMHVHAFRPPEALDAADRLRIPLAEFHRMLYDHGVRSVPGTGARILDDRVRHELSGGTDMPAQQWLNVLRSAHNAGLRSTATMVYGHIETPEQVVAHLDAITRLQAETGGVTEFIAMPLMPQDHPVALPGVRRMADEAYTRAVHAVTRLKLLGHINHIQAAWPKLGIGGARRALQAGANDLGGLLLEGSHPQTDPELGRTLALRDIHGLANHLGRPVFQRTTTYSLIDAFDGVPR